MNIIEKEFLRAEDLEREKEKEEQEIRYRVQRKRFEALDRARRDEVMSKIREDRKLSQEILSALLAHDLVEAPVRRTGKRKGRRRKTTTTRGTRGSSVEESEVMNGSFFVTEEF